MFDSDGRAAVADGDLLVSSRYTSAGYKLDRRSGEVLWRLGGKKNDFELGPGAAFAFQHDARGHPGGLISLFDNGAYSPDTAIESTSRAIVLALDTTAMTARLVRALPNPKGLLTTAMGNMQLLHDGGCFVGWGTTPEFSGILPHRLPAIRRGLRRRRRLLPGIPLPLDGQAQPQSRHRRLRKRR
jgi:hypothetical protein